ncbi:MAG: hypothetical protein Q7R41_08520, partial [Phycisphaerales bacterium]|nr:hypothetical protein [Phycisphaerales bacterium]
ERFAAMSAKHAKEDAEDAAVSRLAQQNAPQSLASAPLVNRDEQDSRLYGSAGIGAAWLFRQESLVQESPGVLVPETSELSSGTLPVLGEIGFADFDKQGRMNVGLRGVGAYNVGGGFAGVGEAVFGSFLESTHSFRLEGFGGVQWETIPTDLDSNYREWRYDVGLGAEFVFANEYAGLLLTGRVLPANDLDDSNAGEVAAIVRARF